MGQQFVIPAIPSDVRAPREREAEAREILESIGLTEGVPGP